MRNNDFVLPLMKILPTFVVCSVVGCIIGRYVFNIPHGQLGVVVSIPLVIGFVLARVLKLLIPPVRRTQRKHHKRDVVLVFLWFSALSLSITMLASALPYFAIGLQNIAMDSLMLSASLFGFSLFMFLLAALTIISAEISLLDFAKIMKVRVSKIFWEIIHLRNDWASMRVQRDT